MWIIPAIAEFLKTAGFVTIISALLIVPEATDGEPKREIGVAPEYTGHVYVDSSGRQYYSIHVLSEVDDGDTEVRLYTDGEILEALEQRVETIGDDTVIVLDQATMTEVLREQGIDPYTFYTENGVWRLPAEEGEW